MSERSCENCSNERTLSYAKQSLIPLYTACPYLDIQRDEVNLKALAALCKYYEERVELCGAVHTEPGNTGLISCYKLQGHSGPHLGCLSTATTINWSDYPIPTAFDKAWEKTKEQHESETSCYSCSHNKMLFRLGWQARGKAVDEQLQKQVNTWAYGHDNGLRHAISMNKNLDAGDECK